METHQKWTDVTNFHWSEDSFTLPELVDKFANHLPFLIKFITGYFGRDEEIHYISGEDVAWFHDILAQERVAFSDTKNRHYSIPISSDLKIHAVTARGREPSPRTIKSLVKSGSLRKFQFPTARAGQKLFCYYGPDDGHDMHGGVYQIQDTYMEYFISIHTLTPEGLYDTHVLRPAYMPVDAVIALGCTKNSVSYFHEMMLLLKDFADSCPHDYKKHTEDISGILYFDEQPGSPQYQTLVPCGVLCENQYDPIGISEGPRGKVSDPLHSNDHRFESVRLKGPNILQELAGGRELSFVVGHAEGHEKNPGVSSTSGLSGRALPSRALVSILEDLQKTYVTRMLPSGVCRDREPGACGIQRPRAASSGRPYIAESPFVGNFSSDDSQSSLKSIARNLKNIPRAGPSAHGDIVVTEPNVSVSRLFGAADHKRGLPAWSINALSGGAFTRGQNKSHVQSQASLQRPTDPKAPIPVRSQRSPELEQGRESKEGGRKRFTSLISVPREIDSLGIDDISQCLSLLNLDKYRNSMEQAQVDGELLRSLDEETLRETFSMTVFEAKKLHKFVNGWRPK